jgi:hypothetical protein
MAKEGDFGGYPEDELNLMYAEWSSTARPGGLTDAQWITKLVDKVSVLTALVKEEHAAANASDTVDIVAVTMKCIDVRAQHHNAVGGAPVVQLVTALAALEAEWGK